MLVQDQSKCERKSNSSSFTIFPISNWALIMPDTLPSCAITCQPLGGYGGEESLLCYINWPGINMTCLHESTQRGPFKFKKQLSAFWIKTAPPEAHSNLFPFPPRKTSLPIGWILSITCCSSVLCIGRYPTFKITQKHLSKGKYIAELKAEHQNTF